MIAETARKIIDLAIKRGVKAEVATFESREATAHLVGGRVRTCEARSSALLGVRVIASGRLGFFKTTAAGEATQALDAALAAAAIGQEAGFEFPGPSEGRPVETVDERTLLLGPADLADAGQQLTASIGRYEPEALVRAAITRGEQHTLLINTAGAEAESRTTRWSTQLSAQRVAGDDVAICWDEISGIAPPADLENIGAGVGRLLESARTTGTLAPGRYPVIFSPQVSFALFLPLLLGVEGRNVLRGVSPLAGRTGEQILDSRVTVIDDPWLPGRPGSRSHDGEGTPTRPTHLVKEGVLKSFLYDLKTAWEAGTSPTGHGQRQPGSEPTIGTSNLVVEPGEAPLDQLMGDIEEGLYVDQLIGLGATNLLAGALSNPVGLGFRIKNGEIAGRVKDLSVAGNAYTMLRDCLGGLSRETRWISGFVSDMSVPYVRIEDVSVTSKG